MGVYFTFPNLQRYDRQNLYIFRSYMKEYAYSDGGQKESRKQNIIILKYNMKTKLKNISCKVFENF